MNEERRKRGVAVIGYGLGLHVGNVMFGNVGLRDRLTFSAFGSAVNEVVRLQLLTKKYASDVVASHAFADYCAGDWITLGEEKLRGVRQRVTILQPGPLMAKMQRDDVEADLHRTGLSEAERLILLHRDAVQLDGQKRSQAMMDRFLQ